ncbi:MAG TPA: sigma-54 dependent transcriptional regulator, partial [Gemmataceae bacterium]|nr:sigma-54 dependent transcriptional regulator [Gemmataceae bacterium]
HSSNGTCINGRVVSEATAEIGDAIQLGEIVLEVRSYDAPLSLTDTAEQPTVLVAQRSDGIDLTGLRADRLPLREEVAAVYSLGASLGNCAQRSEALRHTLDWLREWLGMQQAAAIFRTRDGLKVEAQTGSEGAGLSEAGWSTVRESFGQRRTVVHADNRRHRLSVWIPEVKPTGVLFAEWHDDGAGKAEGYPDLIQAAAQVLSTALVRRTRTPAPEASPQPSRQAVREKIILTGGESMRPVFDFIRQAAAVDATVLITGETGTGKELVAQALHSTSKRSGRPFIVRNCGALPEALFESELFGHEPGAFTGATRRHKGVFEQADGGTLFLDEIGEIPLHLQSKLLRVLEDQVIHRVGGAADVRVDVRLVVATNRDLAQSVADGRFREDLYYRLQVLRIHLPPLRERPGDIRRLAEHFVTQHGERLGVPKKALSPPALQKLESHRWPGNVRELRNTLERAVILCPDATLGPEHIILTESPGQATPIKSSGTIRLDDLERQHILKVLTSVGGNKAKAASILGINRTTLHRKLQGLSDAPA